MKKLNIGCGTRILGGYINLDVRNLPGVNVVHDLRKPLPFPDNEFDYVLAEDILEHFPLEKTAPVFLDWIRVLKPGGTFELFVPNLDKHVELYTSGKVDLHRMSELLYGGQDYPGNFHFRSFNPVTVQKLFRNHGLKLMEITVPGRGIRAKGRKL